ncbi:MAG TPA: DUF1080 domain-containing protein [Planctomycetota bacterium]
MKTTRFVLLPLLVVLGGTAAPNAACQQGQVSAPAAAEWQSLFDGKTLAGWTQRNGTATYRVESAGTADAAIVGRTTEGSPNSFLCTNRDYSDFELKFEVKVDSQLNSGVQIRSQTQDSPAVSNGRVNGPQVEIEAGNANGSTSGYVYGEAAGGWMTPDAQRLPHKHFKNGEWNAYRVLAVGPNIKVWVNGALVSDLTHAERYASHPRGFVGLQVHAVGPGAGPFEVRWRGLAIREIRSKEAGWTRLFNGKDLAGWKTTGNWIVEKGGVLRIEPRPGEEGWERYGAYLWSEKSYKDFILDLEYAYPEGGNSGVYFRVGDVGNPTNTGIEAQILDSSKKEGAMTAHDHGGIISTAAAARNMSRPPGEWNRMILACQGPHLTVDLNGERIIDVALDQSAIKDRPAAGFLGLQDHGGANMLRFRNLWLKELGPAPR